MRRNELEGMLLLILIGYVGTSHAESRFYNPPYGFSSPINVGGETSFGVSSPYVGYSTGSIGNTHNFGTGPSGFSNVYGYNGNGAGYGINSYPGLNGYNNFNHHGLGLGQNSGFYAGIGSGTGTGFGGNFYTSGSHLGSGFGAYNIHRVPYSYNSGLGNYGIHSGIGQGIGNGNGFSLSAGYNGLGGHFGGSIGYGGNYGNGYGYSAHQAFK